MYAPPAPIVIESPPTAVVGPPAPGGAAGACCAAAGIATTARHGARQMAVRLETRRTGDPFRRCYALATPAPAICSLAKRVRHSAVAFGQLDVEPAKPAVGPAQPIPEAQIENEIAAIVGMVALVVARGDQPIARASAPHAAPENLPPHVVGHPLFGHDREHDTQRGDVDRDYEHQGGDDDR